MNTAKRMISAMALVSIGYAAKSHQQTFSEQTQSYSHKQALKQQQTIQRLIEKSQKSKSRAQEDEEEELVQAREALQEELKSKMNSKRAHQQGNAKKEPASTLKEKGNSVRLSVKLPMIRDLNNRFNEDN